MRQVLAVNTSRVGEGEAGRERERGREDLLPREMLAPRFIQTRFMCNFLVRKTHRRQSALSLSLAPGRISGLRCAPFKRERERENGSCCGHFVVEELICKAHFNDIKNLRQ